MRKIIVSLFSFLFLSQAALASHPAGIKDLIENYQYAVEVEWDQKDQQFLERQNQILSEGIQNLVKVGQDPRQMMDEVLAGISEQQFKHDIQSILAIASQEKLSPEQLNEMIVQAASHSSSQGAAWSVWAKIGVGFVATIVVARIALEIYFHEWGKRL